MSKSDLRGDLERLVLELQILESTINDMRSRISLLDLKLNDLRMAISTIEGIEKEKKGAPFLVPIGGNSYIKVQIEDVEKVIVDIGSDFSVEKDLESAKRDLNEKINEYGKLRENLQRKLIEYVSRADQIRLTINEMVRKARAEKNVQ